MYSKALILVLCLAFEPVVAQDISNFTQFFFNPYSINPSYAGIDGKPVVTLSYRRQWSTIEGGPTVVNFSFHTPAGKNLSFGCNVLKDSRGVLSNTGLLLSLGYSVHLTQTSNLRFAVSAGVSFNKVDMSKLADLNDVALAGIANSDSYGLGNAGLSYHTKTFHAGISLPILLKPAYVSRDGFSLTRINPMQSLIFHASYRYYFQSNKYIFEPYLLYRINQGLPGQIEFAGVLHLNHVIYVGGSYKQDFGVSALGGIKVNNTFVMGASYGLKTTGINQLKSPTYEIHLGYLFGNHKKKVFTYSFIDTHIEKEKKEHKPTSEQLAEKHHQEELEHKKKEHQVLADKAAKEHELKKQEELQNNKGQIHQTSTNNEVSVENNTTTNTVVHNSASSQNIQTSVIKTEPRKNFVELPKAEVPQHDTVIIIKHKPRYSQEDFGFSYLSSGNSAHSPEDEQERISRLNLHASNPMEQHNQINHPNADRHEIVKRGNHAKELSVADYVIGGVFKEEVHAKHFSDGLKKLGFKAGYGHLTEKAVWYVYVFDTHDINKARDKRDSLRKTKILRDAWLLTVQY